MRYGQHPCKPLKGDITVPGDKSISHRALLLSAIAKGTSCLKGMLLQGDCSATLNMLRTLGVPVEITSGETMIHGQGLRGLLRPQTPINCLRSGTTMRLGAGILAAQPFNSTLTGDPQLLKRPMRRVTEPLSHMGAHIVCNDDGTPPLRVKGSQLEGHHHQLSIASAQVKSCLLLAGLYAQGETSVTEPGPSRDHTERMMKARGIALESEHLRHTLTGPVERLNPIDMQIPGDFSSASYFIVAATLVPKSCLRVRNVGLNPTRTGLLDVLKTMGARITVENLHDAGGEPVGDIIVEHAELKGITISGELIPRMIDEFPILALAATCAKGTTTVRDAAELRHKESDRISTVSQELARLGAEITPTEDGFLIEGGEKLLGAPVSSHGDHRLAMTLSIAALLTVNPTSISGTECIPDSFPGFMETLAATTGDNTL